MNKALEAFDRISNRFDEYEEFIYDQPYCPEWDSEYSYEDFGLVKETLEQLREQKITDKTIGEHTLNELVEIAAKADCCDNCPLFAFCELNEGAILCLGEGLCGLNKILKTGE